MSRARFASPTGIDRVEMAYARYLLANAQDRMAFTALNAWGQIRILPFDHTTRFIQLMDEIWSGNADHDAEFDRLKKRLLRDERFYIFSHDDSPAQVRRRFDRLIYLLVSHHHLDRTVVIDNFLRETGAQFVCLIHDTIPIDLPHLEYPKQTVRHQRRISTAKQLADTVIVNSCATKEALDRLFVNGTVGPAVLVAHLGVEERFMARKPWQNRSEHYFVCVGTIEPKKNQSMLLDIWDKLGTALGSDAPSLVLIGKPRNGWVHPTVKRIIRRVGSPSAKRSVALFDSFSDIEMAKWIGGATATLSPSLAEGYGLTVPESLALNVPVVCSDLPALREVSGDVPDYLDPMDPEAWYHTILDYLQPDSPRRRAQMERIRRWREPHWSDHFSAVEPVLNGG